MTETEILIECLRLAVWSTHHQPGHSGFDRLSDAALVERATAFRRFLVQTTVQEARAAIAAGGVGPNAFRGRRSDTPECETEDQSKTPAPEAQPAPDPARIRQIAYAVRNELRSDLTEREWAVKLLGAADGVTMADLDRFAVILAELVAAEKARIKNRLYAEASDSAAPRLEPESVLEAISHLRAEIAALRGLQAQPERADEAR